MTVPPRRAYACSTYAAGGFAGVVAALLLLVAIAMAVGILSLFV